MNTTSSDGHREKSNQKESSPPSAHSATDQPATEDADDVGTPTTGPSGTASPTTEDAEAASEASGTQDAAESVRAVVNYGLEGAAEAIIFAADQPVPAERIAEIYAEVTGQAQPTVEAVEEAVSGLNRAYEAEGRALHIYAWAGGYRMATRDALAPFVKTLFVGEQQQTLSRSLMETLAVLAYKQPATRPEVDFIRGVNSDYAIRKLMEMGLVDVQGRSESLGRPLLYGTTSRFLEQFGLSQLDDLPTLREISELLDDPNFDQERAELLQLRAEEQVLSGVHEPSAADSGNKPGPSGDAQEGSNESDESQGRTEDADV